MNTESFVKKHYDRKVFSGFVRGFLPDFDFHEEEINSSIETMFSKITRLGEVSREGDYGDLDLAVYEFRHAKGDPRVRLARDAFKIIRRHGEECGHVLAVFAKAGENNPEDEYRLSLITCEYVRDPKTGKPKPNWSDPRRFSFVLGGGEEKYRRTPAIRLDGEVQNIEELKKRFSVEALTDSFYRRIKTWFLWARKEVKFPGADQFGVTEEEHQSMMTLRLITRLIFIWFLKEKGLVREKLFDKDEIGKLVDLEKFSALSPYYRAILQNLFFATLNTPIDKRKWLENCHNYHGITNERGKQDYFRYKSFFKGKGAEEFYDLCSETPFVNGGLFENLDGFKDNDDPKKSDNLERDEAKRVDCFSERKDNLKPGRLEVPDNLFFGGKGLITILSQYNFTVEENTPNDEDVALDPELLGRVFEGLLDYVSKKTKEDKDEDEDEDEEDTEKKKSGSYYTPREVVDYMVSETLKSYLSGKVNNSECLESLFAPDSDEEPAKYKGNTEFKNAVAKALDEVKILDPACGSGAFPMGMLSKMIQILEKVGVIDIKKPREIYEKKVHIIRDCIYGVDMQNIAVQISKLRFFISLLCEQEVKPKEEDENRGIKQLPNLETKIVCADSLIRLRIEETLLSDKIKSIKNDLIKWRKDYVDKHYIKDKIEIRKNDKNARTSLIKLFEENGSLASPNDVARLTKWDPYSQNSVSEFFEPDWMFGLSHFDIIIGNPPYFRLEREREPGMTFNKYYEGCGYDTLGGDIYCLFYERGLQLLNPQGHICFITSNKWMRAKYGKKLRGLLANGNNPELLIDFPGVKVFPDANVDPNILLLQKGTPNKGKTIGCIVEEEESIRRLRTFVEENHKDCSLRNNNIWIILTDEERNIKENYIDRYGTPIKDLGVKIRMGIKTCYNPAYIINTNKYEEILAACGTGTEERLTTEGLIKRVLTGEEVRRGGHEWVDLWLINVHNGVKKKKGSTEKGIPPVDIKKLPVLKAHLDQYINRLKKRSDQGITPYHLRNCAYLKELDGPKIIYSEIVQSPKFYFDEKGEFCPEATTFMMTGEEEKLRFLTDYLNSNVVAFFFKLFYSGGGLGKAGFRYKKTFLETLPVPPNEKMSEVNDEEIFKAFKLGKDEIAFVKKMMKDHGIPPTPI